MCTLCSVSIGHLIAIQPFAFHLVQFCDIPDILLLTATSGVVRTALALERNVLLADIRSWIDHDRDLALQREVLEGESDYNPFFPDSD